MKHFLITKNGIARLMATDDSVVDPMDEIAKWPEADQAQITAARAIDFVDIPTDQEWWVREGWEDSGVSITVNMSKVRAVFDQYLSDRRRDLARDLIEREMAGEDVTAEKTRLQGFSPDTATATTPAALRAMWPEWL